MTDSSKKRRPKGAGSITKRTNGWEAAITFKGKRPTRLFPTHEEAGRWLEAMIEAKQGKRPAPALGRTVNHYLNELLKKRTTSKAGTVEKASGEMELIRGFLGEEDITDVTGEVVRDFWARINGYEVVDGHLQRIAEGDGPEPSRRALARIRMHLRGAFDLAEEDGVIACNPARPRRRSDPDPLPLPPDRSRVKALSPELTRRFLEAAREDALYPLYQFMLSVGVRVAEARALTWNDLDADAGLVTINKMATVESSQSGVTAYPKTGGSHRVLPVPWSVIELLKEHQRAQQRVLKVLAQAYVNPDLMFSNEKGGMLTTKVINGHIAKRIGPLLPQGHEVPTSKWLRATYASLSLRAGIKIEVVSKRMGHASVFYTFTRYRHLYSDEGHDGVLSADEMIARGSRTATSFQGDSFGFLTSAVGRAFDPHDDRMASVLELVVGTPGDFVTRLARELGVPPAVLADSLARLSTARQHRPDGVKQVGLAA